MLIVGQAHVQPGPGSKKLPNPAVGSRRAISHLKGVRSAAHRGMHSSDAMKLDTLAPTQCTDASKRASDRAREEASKKASEQTSKQARKRKSKKRASKPASKQAHKHQTKTKRRTGATQQRPHTYTQKTKHNHKPAIATKRMDNAPLLRCSL